MKDVNTSTRHVNMIEENENQFPQQMNNFENA